MIHPALKARKNVIRKRRGAGRPAACEVAGRMEHLLDIATNVFLKHGYENANVSDITTRAGASKKTIYSRYPTKADLFIAVITRKTNELQEIYAKTLVLKEPLAKILEDFGMSLLLSQSNPELRALYQVVVAESPEFPKLASAFWKIGPHRLVMMLRDCLVKHPEFKGKYPEHAAEMFCSFCWGMSILKAQLHRDYVMPDEKRRLHVAEAVRIFLAAYTSGLPAR
jgi:AcrR family transcriptional regulator